MQIKKSLCVILCLTMLMCMLAGCGNQESASDPAEQTPSVPGNIPDIAEEFDIALLDKAKELGIAGEEFLSNPFAIATRGQVTELFAKIYDLRYGWESAYIKDAGALLPETEANRLWFSVLAYYSSMEFYLDGAAYKDMRQWMKYVQDNETVLCYPPGAITGVLADGSVGSIGIWEICGDVQAIQECRMAGMEGWDHNYDMAANYALLLPDRTTDEKVIDLDGSTSFEPEHMLTVGEAVETAVRYYNALEPKADMVPYAEITDYDHNIITDDLLAKETSLPDASCQHLPKEWHGVLVSELGCVPHQTLNANDRMLMEADLDIIKEAGFNFVGLMVDFSLLQGFTPVEGTLNEERLKVIDQILAWCMEKDIHLEIRCVGGGGLTAAFQDDFHAFNREKVNSNDTAYITQFADIWGALAHRYKDIPNTYLSFNLMVEPEVESEENYARFFTPAVKAIQKISPDRCMIADIHAWGLTGESMAKLGVALSYHQYDPREFAALEDPALYNDPEYMASVTWPYNGIDAEATMTMPMGGQSSNISVADLMKTAEKYDVGVMIGEFGCFTNSGYDSTRYSDETVSAYVSDMVSVFDKNDLAWCWGPFYNSFGIITAYPVISDTTYSERAGTSYLVDDKMMALFQGINGVN